MIRKIICNDCALGFTKPFNCNPDCYDYHKLESKKSLSTNTSLKSHHSNKSRRKAGSMRER